MLNRFSITQTFNCEILDQRCSPRNIRNKSVLLLNPQLATLAVKAPVPRELFQSERLLTGLSVSD